MQQIQVNPIKTLLVAVALSFTFGVIAQEKSTPLEQVMEDEPLSRAQLEAVRVDHAFIWVVHRNHQRGNAFVVGDIPAVLLAGGEPDTLVEGIHRKGKFSEVIELNIPGV